MIACDSDDVNLKEIEAMANGNEINRDFTNQKRVEQLIKMGFKVKFFKGCWNLIMASGYPVCKLDTTGTKMDALQEALQYVKVKRL